jgi:hypothetical protein
MPKALAFGHLLLRRHLDEVEIKSNLPKRGGWLRKKESFRYRRNLY